MQSLSDLVILTVVVVAGPWRQLAVSGQVALQLVAGSHEQPQVGGRGAERASQVFRVVLHPHKVGVT